MALLILTTGQAAAAARGMSGAQGVMEICVGTSPVMVYVDAEGQPIAPPHLCPDWAQSLFAMAGSPPDMALVPASYIALDPVSLAGVKRQAAPVDSLARGPPARV